MPVADGMSREILTPHTTHFLSGITEENTIRATTSRPTQILMIRGIPRRVYVNPNLSRAAQPTSTEPANDGDSLDVGSSNSLPGTLVNHPPSRLR